MSIAVNKPKSSASVLSNKGKNSSSATGRLKAGRSWKYGQSGYTYGMGYSDVGQVFYGKVGVATSNSIINKNKN